MELGKIILYCLLLWSSIVCCDLDFYVRNEISSSQDLTPMNYSKQHCIVGCLYTLDSFAIHYFSTILNNLNFKLEVSISLINEKCLLSICNLKYRYLILNWKIILYLKTRIIVSKEIIFLFLRKKIYRSNKIHFMKCSANRPTWRCLLFHILLWYLLG